jgi:acyl-coenzyme A thioesterase PaaI-like protein
MTTPAQRLLGAWDRWHRLPGGAWLFSRFLGLLIPYSGSVRPLVRHLEPGLARVALADRRAVRNHLQSIHALALANLGELTSGLALTVGLPATVRGIVTGLAVEYLKKARGPLEATCRCDIPVVNEARDYKVHAEIRDQAGDVVARVTTSWRLSPA